MSRRPAVAVLAPLLAVALTAACGGPGRQLDVGFKEVPSNVVLGDQRSPAPSAAPGPGLVPLPPPPGVVSLPPPPLDLPDPLRPDPAPPLPPAPACPSPDLLAAPAVEAPANVGRAPTPAAYVFANRGTYSVSGADARKGSFPERTVRVFTNVTRLSAGSFRYDVAERIGDVTTTTTYRVVTDVQPPLDATPAGNGVFLDRVTYSTGSRQTAFTPTTPPMLAALPLVRGATSEQRAADPQTQTVMTFTSTVEGKKRVHACAVPLDSWTIRLTGGRIVSPSQDLGFDATYQLATQFGGIVIADAVAYAGTDGDAGVERANVATITQVPR